MTVRLHLGCGPVRMPGWINADRRSGIAVDLLLDLRRRLPFADASVDCAAAMHVLQDLAWPDIAPTLAEIRRVLKPGGTVRFGLPDLDRAIDAYRRGDTAYFHVPDEHARSPGAKLVTQIIWYGSVRTPFTFDFAHELLVGARYAAITRCAYGETASRYPELATADNRPRESLFVEATR